MNALPPLVSELTGKDSEAFLRKLSKIKLVLCDVDGTLVETLANEVAEEIRHFCRKMHSADAGPKLSIATGRPLGATIPIADQLHLPHGSPVICWDGAAGFLSGNWQPLWMVDMDNAVQQKLLRFVDLGAKAFLQYYLPPSTQYPRGGHVVRAWDLQPHDTRDTFFLPTGGDVLWHTEVPDFLEPAVGAVLLGESQTLIDQMMDQLERLPEMFLVQFLHFGNHLIGVHPAGTTKGDAVVRLAKHLGLTLDEIMAIGDSNNDVEMLQLAGIGIAVAGSTEKAQAAADYVCDGGAVLGVIEVLERLTAASR